MNRWSTYEYEYEYGADRGPVFPGGAEPLWARAVTRGHAPLYEESWTLM